MGESYIWYIRIVNRSYLGSEGHVSPGALPRPPWTRCKGEYPRSYSHLPLGPRHNGARDLHRLPTLEHQDTERPLPPGPPTLLDPPHAEPPLFFCLGHHVVRVIAVEAQCRLWSCSVLVLGTPLSDWGFSCPRFILGTSQYRPPTPSPPPFHFEVSPALPLNTSLITSEQLQFHPACSRSPLPG